MNTQRIREILCELYGDTQAEQTLLELNRIVAQIATAHEKEHSSTGKKRFSEKDAALISYATTIEDNGRPRLAALCDIVEQCKLYEHLTVIHLLPFFPWDCDRGFSVLDYYEVESQAGSWDDIQALAKHVQLMFDFVANHASIDNPIVQAALIERHLISENAEDGDAYDRVAPYKDFVIAFSDEDKPSEEELSKLSRPRPTPVLSPYVVIKSTEGYRVALGEQSQFCSHNVIGSGWVWTTFSRPCCSDGMEATKQVDLNYGNPQVLLEVVKILMFYRQQGASLIRLDAVGYLWKTIGSSSLHEPKTHLVLEVLSLLLEVVSPDTVTVAEVNEPQEKVLSYLGTEEAPEADWIYQFTHFPLALYSLMTENCDVYKSWLSTIACADGKQFITCYGTHDGVGIKPVIGVLTQSQISNLTSFLENERGGRANYAQLPGGKKIVYEVCGTPWTLINGQASEESFKLQLRRYLTVLGMSFLVRGLPAIYINGLLGSANYIPNIGLDENRTVNREVFQFKDIMEFLKDPACQMHQVFTGIQRLLSIRASHSAFSPYAQPIELLDGGNDSVLVAYLPGIDTEGVVMAINVSGYNQQVCIPVVCSRNLLTGAQYENASSVRVEPYDMLLLLTCSRSICNIRLSGSAAPQSN